MASAACNSRQRYRTEEGEIEVDSIMPITFGDITPVFYVSGVSRACTICLKWQNTGEVKTFILFTFNPVTQ